MKKDIRFVPYKLLKSFQYALLFLCVVCNLLFTSLIVVIATTEQTKSLEAASLYYTRKILSQAVSNMEASIEPYQKYIYLLSTNNYLISCINDYKKIDIEKRLVFEKKYKTFLNGIIELNPEIKDIVIVGNNGYLYNKDAGKELNRDYDFLNSSWYKEALRYDSNSLVHIAATISDFYVRQSPLTNLNLVTISYPILNYQKEKIGVVFCYIDASTLSQSLFLPSFDEYGGIFLCDKNFKIILHHDPSLNGTTFHRSGKVFDLHDFNNYGDYDISGEKLLSFLPSNIYDAQVVCEISLAYVNKSGRNFAKNLMAFLILGTGISFLLSIFLFFKIRKHFNLLIYDIDKINYVDPVSNLHDYYYHELNTISKHFNEMLIRVTQLNNENHELQLEAQKARLDSLISQINPHFLFNTLQLLQTEFVCGNKDTASALILSLSKIFRYSIVKSNDNILIKISDELIFINNYLQICCGIYNNNVKYTVSCPEEASEYLIPKFILQPIIENCFVHGFQEEPKNNSIRIAIHQDADLVIAVWDDGTGMSAEKISNLRNSFFPNRRASQESRSACSHIGLKNIAKRLFLMYGERYGLSIKSKEHEYTEITIRLPIIKG